MVRKTVLLASLVLGSLWASEHQQILLKNGTSFNGTFISGNARSVIFQDPSGTRRRFNLTEIESIHFGAGLGVGASDRNDLSGSTGARASLDSAVIPSGTEFVVRTNERIDAEEAAAGRFYSATI